MPAAASELDGCDLAGCHQLSEPRPDLSATPPSVERTALKIVMAISFAHGVNDVCQFLLPATYPMFKEALHLNYQQVGLITFIFQVTSSLLQPIVGLYTDRRPQPYALAIGMIGTLVGLLVLSQAHSLNAILVAATLIGVGSSIFHPEASRMAHMAAGGRHGLSQSLFQVGGNFGSSLAPLAAAWVVFPRGQGAIAWLALPVIAGIFVLTRVGHWYNSRLRERLGSGRPAHVVAGPAYPTRHIVLSICILLVLIVSKFFYLVSFTNYYTFYLMDKFGISVQASQTYLFVFMFGIAAGTVAGGPIGDRFGRKWVIWFSILGVAPFALLLPYANLPVTVALSVVIGAILSSAFPAILVYAQELIPGKVGAVAGLFFGFAFGMSGIASAAVGALADRTSIRFVFDLAAYLPLIGLIAGFLPDVKKPRTNG